MHCVISHEHTIYIYKIHIKYMTFSYFSEKEVLYTRGKNNFGFCQVSLIPSFFRILIFYLCILANTLSCIYIIVNELLNTPIHPSSSVMQIL